MRLISLLLCFLLRPLSPTILIEMVVPQSTSLSKKQWSLLIWEFLSMKSSTRFFQIILSIVSYRPYLPNGIISAILAQWHHISHTCPMASYVFEKNIRKLNYQTSCQQSSTFYPIKGWYQPNDKKDELSSLMRLTHSYLKFIIVEWHHIGHTARRHHIGHTARRHHIGHTARRHHVW
jgi:hypothetical protein